MGPAIRGWGAVLGTALLLLGSVRTAVATETPDCNGVQLNSTFELIQRVVFEGHGCTSATCHSGPLPSGGLDLSPAVAYDNLIDQPPQSVSTEQFPGLARVIPTYKGRSLLWLNLAAFTQPELWTAPLRPMPLGGFAPLSFEELELVQLWIEHGATRTGVVPGTERMFDACLPPPEPLKVEPLPPPPDGIGVQIRAPHQVLPPKSEREVCFVSAYDLTGKVPEDSLGPNGDTFRYKRVEARQDPLSHHAVVIVYEGATPITSSVWGPFACRTGEANEPPCDPTDPNACGGEAICASAPKPSLACIGFGPGDASIGVAEKSLFNTMGTVLGGGEPIYEEAPLKGILVWNSHAFNVTDKPASLDMWLNFEFASLADQQYKLERFVDISGIAKMRVPPFGVQEVCNFHTFPAGTRALDLSSHVHQRGRRVRVFEGKFACNGGPANGQPCSPLWPDVDLPTDDLCFGAPCESEQPPRAGDCNRNMQVSVDEVIHGVNIALGSAPVAECPRFDMDESQTVSIDELVAAVDSAIHPGMRDPQESLIYTSVTYADPLILAFNPPWLIGGPEAMPVERTFTYCGLYNNGFPLDTETVKRRSRVPSNTSPCPASGCVAGLIGQPCSINSHCDSSLNSGDGVCDACLLTFGVTTDDEMFVLAGSFIRREGAPPDEHDQP